MNHNLQQTCAAQNCEANPVRDQKRPEATPQHRGVNTGTEDPARPERPGRRGGPQARAALRAAQPVTLTGRIDAS